MKVLIYIFGEGDFKRDTLESRLVPVFASHLKYSFEKNSVPTAIFETDEKVTDNPITHKEITHLLHSNVDIYDELRKAQEITNNLNHLPDNWRNTARAHSPKNDYNNGWCYGVKWCADELEKVRGGDEKFDSIPVNYTMEKKALGRKKTSDCKAVLYHGPGHQSIAHCEKKGEHSIHFTRYGSYETPCYWKGNIATTGFFDDPPENQDEFEKALK
jgi:hypothetical protein